MKNPVALLHRLCTAMKICRKLLWTEDVVVEEKHRSERGSIFSPKMPLIGPLGNAVPELELALIERPLRRSRGKVRKGRGVQRVFDKKRYS